MSAHRVQTPTRLAAAKRWTADRILGRPATGDGAAHRREPSTDRGGATGTPSHDADEAPPALDQAANRVISGGGVVDDRGGPSHKAQRSR